MSTKKRKQGKRKPRWLPRLPPTINAKQVVIGLLPYILIAWVGDKMGGLQGMETALGAEERIDH